MLRGAAGGRRRSGIRGVRRAPHSSNQTVPQRGFEGKQSLFAEGKREVGTSSALDLRVIFGHVGAQRASASMASLDHSALRDPTMAASRQ